MWKPKLLQKLLPTWPQCHAQLASAVREEESHCPGHFASGRRLEWTDAKRACRWQALNQIRDRLHHVTSGYSLYIGHFRNSKNKHRINMNKPRSFHISGTFWNSTPCPYLGKALATPSPAAARPSYSPPPTALAFGLLHCCGLASPSWPFLPQTAITIIRRGELSSILKPIRLTPVYIPRNPPTSHQWSYYRPSGSGHHSPIHQLIKPLSRMRPMQASSTGLRYIRPKTKLTHGVVRSDPMKVLPECRL